MLFVTCIPHSITINRTWYDETHIWYENICADSLFFPLSYLHCMIYPSVNLYQVKICHVTICTGMLCSVLRSTKSIHELLCLWNLFIPFIMQQDLLSNCFVLHDMPLHGIQILQEQESNYQIKQWVIMICLNLVCSSCQFASNTSNQECNYHLM